METVYVQRCAFRGLNPPDVNNPKWYGNPKLEENFGFQEFISPILSAVEKFAEFNVRLFFKSEEKWPRYRQ